MSAYPWWRGGHRERLLRNRLTAWEEEARTNQHGMAYMATGCIAAIREELTPFEAPAPSPTTEEK